MLTLKQRRELKGLKNPLVTQALNEVLALEEKLLLAEHAIDLPSLFKEIKTLKETIKTQQDGFNAASIVIDELRKENEALKKGLYLRDINNEMGRLKQEVTRTTEAYIKLSERYHNLRETYKGLGVLHD